MTKPAPPLAPPSAAGLDRIAAWTKTAAIAQWLQFDTEIVDDRFRYHLGFGEQHIGNPVSRHLHGGVVSTFLQASAQAEITARLKPEQTFRLISVHCNYLRPARAADLTAEVSIVQAGRRLAFLDAKCWQGTDERCVAEASIAARLLSR